MRVIRSTSRWWNSPPTWSGSRPRRNLWERKVALLRSDRIDPDMLDEQARLQLNFAHPNDLVLMVQAPLKRRSVGISRCASGISSQF